MSWIIKWDGAEFDSDDMTIADLGAIEKESGAAWSVANPFRDSKVARAFLAVVLRRQGKSKKEVDAILDSLTLATLKTAFAWRDDDDEESGTDVEVDPSAPTPSSTSPGSSPSESGTASDPVNSGKSDSATS